MPPSPWIATAATASTACRRRSSFRADWLQRASERPRVCRPRGLGARAARAVWFRFHRRRRKTAAAVPTQPSCALLLLQPRDASWTTSCSPSTDPADHSAAGPAGGDRADRPRWCAAACARWPTLGESMRTIGPAAPEQRLPAGETRELAPLVERFNEVLERMQEGMRARTPFRRRAGARDTHPAGRIARAGRRRAAASQRPNAGPGAGRDRRHRRRAGGHRHRPAAAHAPGGGHRDHPVRRPSISPRRSIGSARPWPNWRPCATSASRSVPPPQSLQLVGDPSVLGIVLGNLLRNAAAYAPRGSAVRLAWDAGGLRLDNDAPELTAEDVAQFGHRYWRKQTGDIGRRACRPGPQPGRCRGRRAGAGPAFRAG